MFVLCDLTLINDIWNLLFIFYLQMSIKDLVGDENGVFFCQLSKNVTLDYLPIFVNKYKTCVDQVNKYFVIFRFNWQVQMLLKLPENHMNKNYSNVYIYSSCQLWRFLKLRYENKWVIKVKKCQQRTSIWRYMNFSLQL